MFSGASLLRGNQGKRRSTVANFEKIRHRAPYLEKTDCCKPSRTIEDGKAKVERHSEMSLKSIIVQIGRSIIDFYKSIFGKITYRFTGVFEIPVYQF